MGFVVDIISFVYLVHEKIDFYFDGGTGKRSFPENHYLWPIPIEEIRKSTLTQNPGY